MFRNNEILSICRCGHPPFCPISTCSIMCSLGTLQQLFRGPLLLMQLIFSKPPWRLWLRNLSNPFVTFGSPNLDLGFFLPFQDNFRYTWPIRYHLRPTQAPQAHLDTIGLLGTTLGPLKHPRSIQMHLAHQAPPQAHLGILSPFRYTWPIRHHLRRTQAHLGTLYPT